MYFCIWFLLYIKWQWEGSWKPSRNILQFQVLFFPAEPDVETCIRLICSLVENILVSFYSYTLCWELGLWTVLVVYTKYQLLWWIKMCLSGVKIQLLLLISFILYFCWLHDAMMLQENSGFFVCFDKIRAWKENFYFTICWFIYCLLACLL